MATKCPGEGCITSVAIGELVVDSIGKRGHLTLAEFFWALSALGCWWDSYWDVWCRGFEVSSAV